MARIEIRHRSTGAVLYAGDGESVLEVVAATVQGGADLRGADLARADLRGADLYGADLGGANLGGANLSGATANKWTRWPDGFTVPASVVTL